MVVPGGDQKAIPFPLNAASPHYYYLARNGIYAMAQAMKLDGQEVLFPSYYMGVERDAMVAAGAKLKFFNVDANMRVDVGDIAAKITPETRAVYLIHYLGFPGPVEEIQRLCREKGLLLIEDCALSLLSKIGEKPLGSFGDAAIFCLYKALPLPNGGVLVMKDPKYKNLPSTRRPSLLSTGAYTTTALWRGLRLEGSGIVDKIVWKGLSAVRAARKALGIFSIASLEFDPAGADLSMSRMSRWIIDRQNFPNVIAKRRANYLHLLSRLRNISEPVFDGLPDGVCPLFYPLRTRNKEKVFNLLLAEGIESINFWSRPKGDNPVGMFPGVDELRETILELPCHQDITPEEIDRIAETVLSIRGEI
jgi:dTDP-4-amino-4,6-dideoxygalactose transaminase